MKKWVLLVIPVLALGFAFYIFQADGAKSRNNVQVGSQKLSCEIADTPAKRTKGLSGRKNFVDGNCLLFPLGKKDLHAFWMKDMLFPIDIIWINDTTVVDISANLPIPEPGKSLPLYRPKAEANYAVEVAAGYAKRHSIQIGDTFTWK